MIFRYYNDRRKRALFKLQLFDENLAGNPIHLLSYYDQIYLYPCDYLASLFIGIAGYINIIVSTIFFIFAEKISSLSM